MTSAQSTPSSLSPPGLENKAPSAVPPVPSLLPEQHLSFPTPGLPSQSHRDRDDREGQDPSSIGHEDGSIVEDELEFDSDFEDSEPDSEEDEEPDTINGLGFF